MPASQATEVPAPERSEAKYLGFVSDGASSATKYAGDTYSTVRSKVSGWKHIEAVLDFVESTASPWGAKAQDVGTKALLFADGTVEKGHTWVKIGTDKANETSKSWLGEERYKGLTDAANTMGSEVSDVYSTARSKGVVPAGSKAWEKTKSYAGSAYTYCSEAMSKGKENGQSYSGVLFEKVSGFYSSVHSAVTSSPYYASLHNLTYKTASYVASLSVVKKPAEAVFSATYPHLKGYVDPAISKIEPRMQALQQHLEPRTSDEAVTSDPKQLKEETKTNAKQGAKQAKQQAKAQAPSAE